MYTTALVNTQWLGHGGGVVVGGERFQSPPLFFKTNFVILPNMIKNS